MQTTSKLFVLCLVCFVLSFVSGCGKQNAKPGVESQMKRGHLFLESSNWRQATEYFDKVLDIDPEYAPAYTGKLCAELGVRSEADLADLARPISDLRNFELAVRFADNAYRKTLEGYDKKIVERRKSTFVGVGADFNLYGKTLDDEDFDWKSLREKYVLVKFTATWSGPAMREIPGMLEAYEKYHDKGLEIVSVYIWEHGDSVAKVKKFVEKEKLPWIIVSESPTTKSGQPPQGSNFGIESVPTMLLVDKGGKVLATDIRGERLKQELKKLFDE